MKKKDFFLFLKLGKYFFFFEISQSQKKKKKGIIIIKSFNFFFKKENINKIFLRTISIRIFNIKM